METSLHNDLLTEQKKTNELLTQLVHEQHKKNGQESRHFWFSLIWHSLPLIISAIFLWQIYNYVQAQVDLFQNKMDNVQNELGTFNLGDKLRSLIN